ncbi:unnamed protein product [Brassicogethes aeneus]|uniref:Uncharacterized protein n=1 Tax=Brassicogethes aeneus TaxID=1431903 RepID=A0A9P0FJX7_BRAAE|nr:unnamed protein product [Brassicogethes aeneus]
MSKNSIRSNRRDSKNQSKQSNISTKVKSDETCNSETNGEKSFGGREELTSIFFNFMLETIVESREAQLVSSSVSDLPQNLEKVIYKDVTEDDFTKSEVMGTLESNVLLKLKHPQDFRESDSKANRMELSGASESRLITYVESNSKNSAQQTQDILIEMESIIFLNGNQYLGEVSEGIMHGKGTFYWTDGTIYEGTFNEGFPTGIGKMILPDLATYNGEFFKGEFHGGGTLNVINTSMIYSGNWNDGKKCAGWLLYQPKDWYEGEWLEGHRHGFGFRQYRMGGCYEGSWIKGEKSGKGMMLYSNNNIYKGGWNNEVPHGYGEYYWNSFVNKTLVYPMTPWFKGTWNKGCRHGAGVMNFGSESGARLAGIWLHNLKHGPGVMICGNGHAIQKAPLFLHDKAVLTDPDESVEPPLNHPTPEEETEINNITLQQQKQTFHDVSTANSYPDIIKEINKKIPMENINPEIVESIKAKQSKRKIPDINHVFNCNQIETPIHASPEHVDLNHFIDSVLQFSLEKVYSSGRLSFEPLQMDNVKNRTYSVLRIIEQTQIKNTITLHLVKLKDLYERYACVATEEEVDFPKVMIRLFLWQLYRDIELTTNGLSLFEVDFGLADNPQSCVEAVHDPFEPIYFWQFIQSLVGTSVLLHKKGLLQIEPKGALLSSIFKHFITKQLLNKMNGTRDKHSLCYIPSKILRGDSTVKNAFPSSNSGKVLAQHGSRYFGQIFAQELFQILGQDYWAKLEPDCGQNLTRNLRPSIA